MSYAYNGREDEVDYGEDEAAHEIKDEIAEEEEYEDLYDDVNIGFFQAEASSVKQPDGYGMATMYGEEVIQEKKKTSLLDEKKQFSESAVINQPNAQQIHEEFLEEKKAFSDEKKSETATFNQSNMQHYGSFQHPKEEPIRTITEQEKGTMSISVTKQEIEYKPSIQQTNIVSTLPTFSQSGKDVGQRGQMQFFLSSTRKDTDNVYKLEKQAPSYEVKASGDGHVDPVSQPSHRMNVQTTTGPSRGPLNREVLDVIIPKERAGLGDMAYDRTRGITVASQRPGQRDVSPNVVDNEYKQAVLQPTHPPYSGDGGAMLFIGDLHWWATDAELEAALSEYGRVKNLKFFEERVSGKSKGYCQVEFYDHGAAVACKEGMNGRKFHDRPCVVALGNARSIQQMGHQQEKKTQAQIQTQQEQMPYRRGMGSSGSGGGRGGGGSAYQDRENNRGYGRMGTGRSGHGQGRGGQSSSGRGRGSYMGKGMNSGGMPSATGMPYGQGPVGSHQSAMMMHQAMMGQGYDTSYMPLGRGGAAYGGYVMPGPPFSGIVGPFPGLGPGALPGVAPHVNPAFFGRSVAPAGMGLMSGGGMEGPQGMWGDASLGGWSGEEYDRRGGRDGSFAEDGVGMEYGYGSEMASHEKSRVSGGAWDKESGDLPDRHRSYDRDVEWERERFREKDKEGYKDQRDRDKDREKDEDWERERPVRVRTKSRVMDEEEDDPRQRPREDDYGKRRRVADREL